MVKLLIIEDDELLRGQLASGLADAGHEVSEAANGVIGLRLFNEIAPDLVLTDIIMDEGEGLGAIMALRRVSQEIPIIAMSGNPVYLNHGLKLGATESLLKPFSMAVLSECITRLAGGAAAKSA